MKKHLFSGLAVMLVSVVSIWLYMVTKSPDARVPSTRVIKATPELRARGEYLVNHVAACLGCHSKRDRNLYGAPIVGYPGAGGTCFTEKWDVPGRVCPPNLTPDKATGLGSWTDGEIQRAFREGVDRHGSALFPLMPYRSYRHLSDTDADAIVVYLKTLKQRAGKVDRRALEFPAGFFITLLPQPLSGPVAAPARHQTLRYGEYLAKIARCQFCHTPTDREKRPLEGRDFSGGFEFNSPHGVVRSTNLTPHQTGLAAWSKQQFIDKFHAFRDEKAQKKVHPSKNTPMPWLQYAGMTTEDLGAIYEYLRQLPALDNRVKVRD